MNKAARTLYHEYAKDMPIYDYHCHLPPQDIAENRQFRNLTHIWLAGDHYKWGQCVRTALRNIRLQATPMIGKVSSLGQDRAIHDSESSVSLDAPGT
jgi:glucuronate isomerase